MQRLTGPFRKCPQTGNVDFSELIIRLDLQRAISKCFCRTTRLLTFLTMFLYHLIMYGRYHNQIFNNRQIYMKSDEFRASFILFHLFFLSEPEKRNIYPKTISIKSIKSSLKNLHKSIRLTTVGHQERNLQYSRYRTSLSF